VPCSLCAVNPESSSVTWGKSVQWLVSSWENWAVEHLAHILGPWRASQVLGELMKYRCQEPYFRSPYLEKEGDKAQACSGTVLSKLPGTPWSRSWVTMESPHLVPLILTAGSPHQTQAFIS
jgi:hypothetical protein